ncbi:baseplate J/gp47 family protein [Schlesneria sp. DSM 10557]|uniref:baseplate J/gp47 family protein n=1 Tax=Schlesneria sp. DSM 10557 TaxID=3044399 RepID=UPI0035A135B9
MSDFGVTSDGFAIKPLQEIINDKAALAREIFGDDIDLRSTSAFRQIMNIVAASDMELWKLGESSYYSCFPSTATGDALDLLGDDLGIPRRALKSHGTVVLTLEGGKNGRSYNIPAGAVVETLSTATDPAVRFRTLQRVSLTNQAPTASVEVEAIARGPAGNVAKNAIKQLNPDFARAKLSFDPALVTATNANATMGGENFESDEAYRLAILGRPRTLWTLEAVRSAVIALDGVRDCRLFDPLGGVDVSQSKFSFFSFGRGRFGKQRRVGTPFYFDILVAVAPGFFWESTTGKADGVRDLVNFAVDEVRPISVFPNLRLANDVQIGLRAIIMIQPGHDADAIIGSIKDRLERRVNSLGLGNSVLYSQVIYDCKDATGLIDIQQLHLRRNPPLMGSIAFGRSPRFNSAVIEFPIGENINLQPDEIAVFHVDSQLIDIQVSNT